MSLICTAVDQSSATLLLITLRNLALRRTGATQLELHRQSIVHSYLDLYRIGALVPHWGSWRLVWIQSDVVV